MTVAPPIPHRPPVTTETGEPTLTVNMHIAVAGGAPALERMFALADRLHTLAVEDATGAQVSTTISVVDDPDARYTNPAPTSPPPDLVLLADRRLALVDGTPLHLTRIEYDLLLYLADNGGRVLTRAHLLRQVWDYHQISGMRTVDVHIRRLRAKLAGRGPLITTVRGVGYRLDHLHRVTVVRDIATSGQTDPTT